MTLEILTADALSPIRHGFFTRKGGASSGIFKGLNCGQGSSDQKEAVAINRNRVAEAMQVTPDHLVSLHQHHSADVILLTGPRGDRPKGDAMVTATGGIALAILTADCQPVLFADVQNQVIGAAHAGWGGAIGGVLEATIDAMIAMGAQREAIYAVIGPSISQQAYEVGQEYLDRFVEDDPENTRFFAQGQDGKYQFDLPAYGLQRLRRAGIEAEWTRHCTYQDPDRFYSYRRCTHAGEADYGRQISCIRL